MSAPSETVFVGDLPGTFEDAQLTEIFGQYGVISSSKLLPVGGYGTKAAIVTYSTKEEAQWIVENLNGNIPQGLESPVKIKFKEENKGKGGGGAGAAWGAAAGAGDAWGKAEGGKGKWDGGGEAAWGAAAGSQQAAAPPNQTLFIGNLPSALDDATFRTVFGVYGTIKSCKLMEPNQLGFRAAVCEFSTLEEAQWIQENLNGNLPEGLTGTESIVVRFKTASAPKGGDGKGYGKGPYGGDYGGKEGGKSKGKGKDKDGKCSARTLVEGLMASGAMPGGVKYENDENTLFVGGLPSDTTDTDLFLIFSPFGAIAPKGIKAMLSPPEYVRCKGFGFVNYLTAESTNAAVATLHGTQMPDGSVLTVSVKKEGKGKGDDEGCKGMMKGGKDGKGFKGKAQQW